MADLAGKLRLIAEDTTVVLRHGDRDVLREAASALDELEGDDGLRARCAAGWAIAGARAEEINKLNARIRELESAPVGCRCRAIQAVDPRRHFQGCPLRRDL